MSETFFIPDVAIVSDGQSHTNSPAGNAIPDVLARKLGVPHHNSGIGGWSWTTLLDNQAEATSHANRTLRFLNAAQTMVYLMIGGTQDVLDGDTGAQIYADHVRAARAARAHRPSGLLIVACTIPPSDETNPLAFGHFTPAEEAQRVAANALILGDAQGAFDLKIDLDVAPFNDPTEVESEVDAGDGTWAIDGVHYSVDGAEKITTTLIYPVVKAAL